MFRWSERRGPVDRMSGEALIVFDDNRVGA